jgi:hypothetical protein
MQRLQAMPTLVHQVRVGNATGVAQTNALVRTCTPHPQSHAYTHALTASPGQLGWPVKLFHSMYKRFPSALHQTRCNDAQQSMLHV